MATNTLCPKHFPKEAEMSGNADTISQLIGLYFLVVVAILTAWALGCFQMAFYWTFLLCGFIFVVWRTKLRQILRNKIFAVECLIHRKRALRQNESSEWLNFILNRWWVFASNSIEDIVKKHIDERLISVKPGFISQLQLSTFTFGETTPTVQHVKAFELTADGPPFGRRPIAWSSIWSPPQGLENMSSYQVVLELNLQSNLEDFLMVFLAKVGSGRAGLNFDVAVEGLSVSGNLQLICHMSMDVPFPHVSKVTASFTEKPEIWFNIKVLKSLQIMEVPLLKSWIQANIDDGITKALVDPGKIDIPIVKYAGPLKQRISGKSKSTKLAQGVLTITVKGRAFQSEDKSAVLYTMLRIGDRKRQTPDHLCTEDWTDTSSFFVYNPSKDTFVVKHKCRRLLSNVTLERHDLELSSFPLEVKPLATTTLDNKDGSQMEVKMRYTKLPPVSLDPGVEREPVDNPEVAGVVFVCVHSATKVIASDYGGLSDPYCVVFSDRRRVLTTPYIMKTINPVWESSVEFFVQDFTKTPLSFYVYDWDGSNIIDDDFLGSAHFAFKEDQHVLIKENLLLGHNDPSKGFVQSADYGYVTVSVTFRPVSSVRKSEKLRIASVGSGPSEYLYQEDLVSPATKSTTPLCVSEFNNEQEQGGGSLNNSTLDSGSGTGGFMEDKTFVDLTILQGKDLMPADRNGLSDPYCVILMGSKKVYKTSVKKNTLFPKWNESTSFQVQEDSHLLEIFVYDKDMISKDFLGKSILTLDKLKEISHKGTAEWIPLQRAKSGQIQIKCTVTCTSSIVCYQETGKKSRSLRRNSRQSSVKNNDIFLPVVDTVHESERVELESKPLPPDSVNGSSPKTSLSPTKEEAHPPTTSEIAPDRVQTMTLTTPVTQLPLVSEVRLRRSVSDVNVNKKPEKPTKSFLGLSPVGTLKHTNSSNSISGLHHGDTDSIDSSVLGHEKLYSVSGKIMEVSGLKLTSGNIYIKVRVEHSGHRLKFLSHGRVIAKSYLFPISASALNQPFEVDRGAGVNMNTHIIFDIKSENKDHLAHKSFSLTELFSDYVDGGIEKWLNLSDNAEIKVFLKQGKPNPRILKKHGGVGKSLSFRK
uniref:Tricalbin-3-like isoform X4 n=1 Tax=Crassostrea virginica TaxID=6565 RepID=A0A8B8DNT6_CRAVI|nr:tricalbin-3-like isoform X4 [Crassostrea virginica]